MSPEVVHRKLRFRFLPFKYPNFGKLLLGQFVSNIGSQFSFIALQFLIYDLTEEILAMAILGIVQAIPMILVGPWAGVIIDRIDRKYSMAGANLAQALVIGLIPFTTIFNTDVRIWWILGLAFCNSAFARFFFPARGASIPKLIDSKEDLFSANSLSAGAYQVTALIGPMLAGIIIGLFGYDIPFFIDASTFIFSSICILWIHRSLRANRNSRQNPLKDLKDSGRFITDFQPILYLIVIFSALMFAGGASMILLVPYLQTVFGLVEKGPRELIFGLMVAASAAVGMTFAFLLSRKKSISKPVTLISYTLLLAGLILIGFGFAGLVRSLLVLALFWIGFGTIEVSVMIPLQTLTQETVPDDFRGKIFSFINLSITTAQILGMGIISIIASTSIGIIGSLMINGLLLIIIFGICIIWLRIKNLEQQATERRAEYYKYQKY